MHTEYMQYTADAGIARGGITTTNYRIIPVIYLTYTHTSVGSAPLLGCAASWMRALNAPYANSVLVYMRQIPLVRSTGVRSSRV